MGRGLTCLSSAGVDSSREHPGLPLRDARGRLPQTGGGTHAAQGPVLGLRHRGECDSAPFFFFCSLSFASPNNCGLSVSSSSSSSSSGRMGAHQRERELRGGPADPPPSRSSCCIRPQPAAPPAADASERDRQRGVKHVSSSSSLLLLSHGLPGTVPDFRKKAPVAFLSAVVWSGLSDRGQGTLPVGVKHGGCACVGSSWWWLFDVSRCNCSFYSHAIKRA